MPKKIIVIHNSILIFFMDHDIWFQFCFILRLMIINNTQYITNYIQSKLVVAHFHRYTESLTDCFRNRHVLFRAGGKNIGQIHTILIH